MMWIAHMRMEGKFYIQKSDEPYDKHVHVLFDLQDGRQLRYHDTRKFGKMYLYEKRKDIPSVSMLSNIGLDAFDERLTPLICIMHYITKDRIKSCSTGSKRNCRNW